ncbi:MAG: RNA polymerase sigma factor [Dehalococcoidia bacterium]|nr:RNA polymerase sigma factor [Dehalococcoidia bacterium]
MSVDSPELKNALSNCFIENQKKLYLTALAITKNHQAAEDALQEAYLKTVKKCHQLKDVAFAKTWITRIVINECKNMLKSNKTIATDFQEFETQFIEDFNDEELRFYSMISNLALEDKEIMTLKYFQGYTLDEISAILNMPLSTVKSRVYRALEKLKSEWSD